MNTDPVADAALHYARLWAAGSQRRVLSDFTGSLGEKRGGDIADTLAAICKLCGLCDTCPRRQCSPEGTCPGADEHCFARLVQIASLCAQDDALMIAVTLVRADAAPLLVALAQDFGLALRCMAIRAERGGQGAGRAGLAQHRSCPAAFTQ